MYKNFEQLLDSMVQNNTGGGRDFIDCCLAEGISPADAEELLRDQLGIGGDELMSVLLK